MMVCTVCYVRLECQVFKETFLALKKKAAVCLDAQEGCLIGKLKAPPVTSKQETEAVNLAAFNESSAANVHLSQEMKHPAVM